MSRARLIKAVIGDGKEIMTINTARLRVHPQEHPLFSALYELGNFVS